MSTVTLTIDGVPYTCTPPVPINGLHLLPGSVTPKIVSLDALAWSGVHDAATSGTATGATAYPVTVGGKVARSLTSDYTDGGGIRYHCVYAEGDTVSDHFILAGWLWLDNPATISQVELDNNQVTADGKTYIFGCQANANDGFWDITNMSPSDHWNATPIKTNPKNWPAKTWVRFEIMAHRDSVGNHTYDGIYFNGAAYEIGMTLPGAAVLGWAVGTLLANIQLGGNSGESGSILVYASGLQVAKW
jgi:hypothetical protein